MVLIKTKRIWPLYIPPQDNELFSSWVCRLAYEHQVKVYTFLKIYFTSNINYLTRNVDLIKPPEVINTLLNHTLLSTFEIDNLFLTTYEGYVFEKNTYNTYTQGIIPLGISNQKRKNFGTLYCPKCLSKKSPYFKKIWRLTTSITCVECKTRLKDRCDKCKEPIAYHLNNLSINTSDILYPQSLKYCQCGHDLSVISIYDIPPSKIEIEYQSFMDKTINNGYNHITQYSFLFLEGFNLLVKKYLHNCKNNRLRENLTIKLKRNDLPSGKKDLGLWSLEERRLAILDIYTLFKNYPHSLNSFLTENKIYKSYIRNNNNYPFWLVDNMV